VCCASDGQTTRTWSRARPGQCLATCLAYSSDARLRGAPPRCSSTASGAWLVINAATGTRFTQALDRVLFRSISVVMLAPLQARTAGDHGLEQGDPVLPGASGKAGSLGASWSGTRALAGGCWPSGCCCSRSGGSRSLGALVGGPSELSAAEPGKRWRALQQGGPRPPAENQWTISFLRARAGGAVSLHRAATWARKTWQVAT